MHSLFLLSRYTVARQVYGLTVPDLSEIARRSVEHSGLSHVQKRAMLGEDYLCPGWKGNDPNCSNVPSCRVDFRFVCLSAEFQQLRKATATSSTRLQHVNTSRSTGWRDLVHELRQVHAQAHAAAQADQPAQHKMATQ